MTACTRSLNYRLIPGQYHCLYHAETVNLLSEYNRPCVDQRRTARLVVICPFFRRGIFMFIVPCQVKRNGWGFFSLFFSFKFKKIFVTRTHLACLCVAVDLLGFVDYSGNLSSVSPKCQFIKLANKS